MNLEYTRNEISAWKKLDKLLDEQFNQLIFTGSGEGYLRLDIDGVSNEPNKLTPEDYRNLSEAWFETQCNEITLDERELVHNYVRDQINTLHRQLMDEVAAIIIPNTEEPT